MEKKKPGIYSVTDWIISDLSEKRETSSGKAALAKLRNSAGRPLHASMQVWPIVFDRMPPEFLGRGSGITAEEQSVLVALQLYAMHQQGRSESVILKPEDGKWQNVGYSLSALRTDENQGATDRRFNALITSATFEELVHHLRQLIKLLKAKSKAQVNYAKLAEDLYWFLRGSEDGIRLNWARKYYGTKAKGEEEHEK